MQNPNSFIRCRLEPILTLTLQPFLSLVKFPVVIGLLILYTLSWRCLVLSYPLSLQTQTHTKAHRFVKYLFHLLFFIISYFFISTSVLMFVLTAKHSVTILLVQSAL